MGLRLGAAPPARRWGLRPALLRPVAVLMLVFGVAISATLASVWQHTVSGQHADRLDRTAASRTTAVGNAIRRYQDVLMAERALVLASTFVSRADFHAFADALEFRRMYPGLQSIGWYADVPGRRLAGFLASARHDGPAGFQVTPPGRRPAYYVALYSEPGGRAGPAPGSDARLDPVLREAMDRARDSGQATLSREAPLEADRALPRERRPAAFRLLVPVYRGHPGNVAERRAALRGWASGSFRARDLLAGSYPTRQVNTGTELYEQTAGSARLLASFPDGFRAVGGDVRSGTLTLGGRRLLLRSEPLPGSPTLTDAAIKGPTVLAVGLALSALLAGLILVLAVVLGQLRTVRLQRAELREANEFKTDLVAMLSHDLRQPLGSVLGYAQLLNGEVDPAAGDDARKFAAKILRGARRLQQLLEDILTMTQLDVGKLLPEPAPVSVHQAVIDTVGGLQDELPAVSHGEVGRVWALVDPGHLQQILANLVGNAAKYGGPPVRIAATEAEGVVEIHVADHGPGVPGEFVPRLFERFARAPSSGGTGTGLGLFIVRQLVEANGGHVSYQPNRPTGACFVVRLPRAAPPLTLAPEAPEQRPQVAG